MSQEVRSTIAVGVVVSRRALLIMGSGLIVGAACGSGAMAASRPTLASPEKRQHLLDAGDDLGGFAPNAFVRITARDEILLIIPSVEVGQGAYTGLCMLIAEELEVDLNQVQMFDAPINDSLFKNPIIGRQGTGGSASIRGFWEPLRTAGAAARTMLIQAAAQRWNVAEGECSAHRGTVIHTATRRMLKYGELVAAASKLPKPAQVRLKPVGQFSLIGRPAKRVDSPAKVTGAAKFGIDVAVEGMKVAAVRGCPIPGGTLAQLDTSAAQKAPGVIQIVRLKDAVAVVGDHYWAAKAGLDALRIEWNPGPNAKLSSKVLWKEHQEASLLEHSAVAVETGDVQRALKAATKRLAAEFRQPFLAHAPMEPPAALVHVRRDGAEIWAGTQVPTKIQKQVADLLGLPQEKVVLHTQLIGGSFGRKLETDVIVQAAAIARQCSFPVKVVWGREEDIQRGNFRPMYVDQISAGLDQSGMPAAWHHRVTGASVYEAYAPLGLRSNGVDPDAVDGAEAPVYGLFPNMRVEFVNRRPPKDLLMSWFRGVGVLHNMFVIESFVDDLARLAGTDPVEYRRRLLAKVPRALAVLDRVARESNWGAALPARSGRGVMVQQWMDTYIAMVIEVTVSPQGEIQLKRATVAVDCGVAVNPELVKQQIEGGVLFGLSTALFSQITFANGKVEQGNFHDYRALRINESPAVDVHLLPSAEHPGGVGETGCSAAAPALRNAILAATGVALYELPIRRDLLRASGQS